MACSYIGYFVWGYYIAHYGIPEKWHRVIYAGVIPAALLNLFVDRYLSLKAGEPRGEFYDSYGVFTFIIVTALFLFFTNVMSKVHYSRPAARIIRELSEATLGVYVMHVGLLEVLEERGIDTMLVPNIIGIPLLALGCYAVCTVVAACLRRIPVLGRYLC
jgi:surface polysaccharide O-acyltransferase-like enzyme